MSGFNGLRVLSFESRRAKEIAQLIVNNGGVPIVAPSTREVPEASQKDQVQLIHVIAAGSCDVLIFMTGIGARALIDAAAKLTGPDEFIAALKRSRVVVRGPKPSAVMREFGIPIWLIAPEPNTWREIVQVFDEHTGSFPLTGKRVGIQEHGEPSTELYDALRQRGAEIFAARVYRWELPEDTGPLRQALQAVCDGAIDVVMFTASVQFEHALKTAIDLKLKEEFIARLNRAVVASIGPVTSATLRENGIQVSMEPSHPKMGMLVREAAEKSAELIGTCRRA